MKIELGSSNATMVEGANERQTKRLATREPGDGAHSDREREKLGPDRIGSEMFARAREARGTCKATSIQLYSTFFLRGAWSSDLVVKDQ